MPPINLQYEPTPFLQVAGSWWGQRRLMAHQVAVQQDQSALQHTAQANQMFQSGMTGARQGAAAYQQAQQFDASLAQQQQLATQQMGHAFEMVDFKNFGMREAEMQAAMQADIAAGAIAAETTVPQYRRRLESQRLKMTQDAATQQAITKHWIDKTGQSPQQWQVAAQAADFEGSWQEYGLTVGRQQRVQEQVQTAVAQQRAVQRLTALGDAEQRLTAAGRLNEVEAYNSALANVQAIEQGHDIGVPLDVARQTLQKAGDDMLVTKRTLEANPYAKQQAFESDFHQVTLPDGTKVMSVPKREGTQVVVHEPDKMVLGMSEDNYWRGLNNAWDNDMRAWAKVADGFAKSFKPELTPEPPSFEATKASFDAMMRGGKSPQQGARSPVDAQMRERYRALGMPLAGAQQPGAQGQAPPSMPPGAPEKMPPERANAINFIAQMQRTGQTIQPGQLKQLVNTYLNLARREMGPGATEEELLSRARALMIADGGGELIE